MIAKNQLLKTELRLIGLIVQHWSYLERKLEELIWTTLEIEDTIGRAITEDIQFRQRIKMMGKLLAAKHKPMGHVWKETAKTLADLEETRNLIVHGIWQRVDGVPHPVAYSARRSTSSRDTIYGEGFPIDRMKGFNDNIITVHGYLVEIEKTVAAANEQLRKNGHTPDKA